jgi:predicted kinase
MSRMIIIAGLPAAGKSTLAREIARRIGAVWLRIDSMDQAIWASGTAPKDLQDWSYRAAQAAAEDNLRLGLDVVADAVNDWQVVRDAWRDVAARAGAEIAEVEVICSDAAEHRRRVETRVSDIPGLVLPTWSEVAGRNYAPWDRDHIVIDTAGRSVEASVNEALAALSRSVAATVSPG